MFIDPITFFVEGWSYFCFENEINRQIKGLRDYNFPFQLFVFMHALMYVFFTRTCESYMTDKFKNTKFASNRNWIINLYCAECNVMRNRVAKLVVLLKMIIFCSCCKKSKKVNISVLYKVGCRRVFHAQHSTHYVP